MAGMEMPDGRAAARPPASVQEEGEPMQTLRATLIAIPFVGLAVLVAVLSVLIGPAQ
jgi:hypothetical protein